MDLIKAIIISFVQGVTEFLPISSSGHIMLFKEIFNFEVESNLFDIVVHFGTLIAVVIFFWQEITELVCGVFTKQTNSKLFKTTLERNQIFKIWGMIIVGIIPAGVVGLLLDDFLDKKIPTLGNIRFLMLGCFFIITGCILLSTRFVKTKSSVRLYQMTFVQALYVGISQAFAILPGISRSGTTISAGVVAGIDKEDAGRFSFILSIPIIAAAFLLKILKILIKGEAVAQTGFGTLAVSMVVSAIVGYFALKVLFKILSSSKFWIFSIYMVIPAVTSFVLFFVK